MNQYEFVEKLQKERMNYYISGTNIMVCCPFHGDTSPSLGINFYKGKYNCLGCDAHGGVKEIIKIIFDEDFIPEEVIEDIEEDSIEDDIRVDSIINKIKEVRHTDNKKLKIKVLVNFDDSNYSKPNENTDSEYWKYLFDRNIHDESIERFSIRCGFWKGDKRILIPMRDEHGRLISVVGRSITTNYKKTKVRKSKGSDANKVLFGLYELLKNKYYGLYRIGVLVEGEIDVIYLQQNSLPAIGVGKKKISDIQMNKLVKNFDFIFVNLDGDADEREVMNCYSLVRSYMGCSVIRLPKNKDPNDLSKKEIIMIYKNVFHKSLE